MSPNPETNRPVPGDSDDDAVWADLVARLQEPDDGFLDGLADFPDPLPGKADDGGPRPGAAPHPGAGSFAGFDPLGVWNRPAARADEGGTAGGPRDYAAEDDEGEFVPPDPPSLANADPAIVAAWVGAAGGPVFLFLAALFWRDIPLLAVAAIIIAFIGSAAYLVYRLPKSRDDDGDDGAVV
ncbi:hypothetical protein [Specibacter cremeus]|uniref:hypothetical protein n=1 Tax=Specibacter cremeus TaxID=1629051 RepID=UPI000F7B760F|nr:hypothetical protein [Specibacter cremeus]